MSFLHEYSDKRMPTQIIIGVLVVIINCRIKCLFYNILASFFISFIVFWELIFKLSAGAPLLLESCY